MTPTDENIVLLESNVSEVIEDVSVYEERINDQYIERFTDEQVLIHLTGLVEPLYNEHEIGKHVTRLNDTLTIYKPINPCFTRLHGVKVYPFVYTKDVFYPSEKEREVLEEEVDGEEHDAPLLQLEDKYIDHLPIFRQAYNMTKFQPFTNAMNQVRTILTPFMSDASQPAHDGGNVDVIHKTMFGYTPMRLMEGDCVKLEGVITIPESMEDHPLCNITPMVVNFEAYKQTLQSFEVRDKCLVCPNTFINDAVHGDSNVLIGIVVNKDRDGIDVQLETYPDIKIHVAYDEASDVYVYKLTTDADALYHKAGLLIKPYMFTNVPDMSYITPKNPCEVLFMYDSLVQIPNVTSIMRTLDSVTHQDINGTSLDIGIKPQLESVLRRLMSRYKSPMEYSDDTKWPARRSLNVPAFLTHNNVTTLLGQLVGRFVDSDFMRFRLLHNILPLEQHTLLQYIRDHFHNILSYIDTHQKNIEKQQRADKHRLTHLESNNSSNIHGSPSGTKGHVLNHITIAKIYHTLKDLYADNEKTVYFDKELDPTPYSISKQGDNESTIRDAVTKKFPQMSLRDIEREVKSISTKRRKVRDGDYCILDAPYGKFMFVRRHVSSKQMWLRVSDMPKRMCTDDMKAMLYKDITDERNNVIVDLYDEVCVNLQTARNISEWNGLKNRLEEFEAIASLTHRSETVKDMIYDMMKHTMEQQGLRRHVFTESNYRSVMSKYVLESDGEYYEAGDSSEENTAANLMMTYEEQQRYDVLQNNTVDEKDVAFLKSMNRCIKDVLLTLCMFMGIKLQIADIKEMVAVLPTPTLTFEAVQPKLEEQLKNGVKQKGNLTKPGFLANLRDLANKRAITELYKEVVPNVIAVLSLFIMKSFPNIYIGLFDKPCFDRFAYTGYPLRKETNKNLTYFMCSLLKTICVKDDPRYAVYVSMSNDQLFETVKGSVDVILRSAPYIAYAINKNKAVLEHTDGDKTLSTVSNKEFIGFKPEFPLTKESENASAKRKDSNHPQEFLALMKEIVKDKQQFKKSLAMIPLLQNSCCLEKLTADVSYYSFMDRHEKGHHFKQIRESLQIQDRGLSSIKRKINKQIVHPPSSDNMSKRVTLLQSIKFKKVGKVLVNMCNDVTTLKTNKDIVRTFCDSNDTFKQDVVMQKICDSYDDDDIWDKFVNKSISSNINTIVRFLTRHRNVSLVNEYVTEPQLKYFEELRDSMNEMDDIKPLKFAFIKYMNCQFGRSLNRFAHAKPSTLVEDKMTNIDRMLLRFVDQTLEVRRDVQAYINTAANNIGMLTLTGDEVKTMYIHQYIMTRILAHTISIVLDSYERNNIANEVIAFTATYISYVITSLLESIQMCTMDVAVLREREEQFREREKELKMSKYSSDIEERREQREREELGFENWDVIGVHIGEPDDSVLNEQHNTDGVYEVGQPALDMIDVSSYGNNIEIQENYRMTYQGENADNDEED